MGLKKIKPLQAFLVEERSAFLDKAVTFGPQKYQVIIIDTKEAGDEYIQYIKYYQSMPA